MLFLFIITAKVDRKKLLIGATLLLLCGALSAGHFVLHREVQTTASVSLTGERKGIRTNEDRIRYLEEFGWTVGEMAAETEELQFPDRFDDPVYEEFLALQQSQGFDPERYTGKRVRRYTYAITNYPGNEEEVFADLYLYRHKVIGGEVFSPKAEGFLHGLARPE